MNAIEEARELVRKCFNEYKEEVPQREIMNAFAMLPMLLSHIDSRDKQIAALKAALCKERAWHFVVGGADECIVPDNRFPGEHDCYCVDDPTRCPAFDYLKQVARDQLARELPEIDWEES